MRKRWYLLLIPVFMLSCAQNAENSDQNDDGEKEKSEKEVEADVKASTLIEEGQKVPAFSFTTTGGEDYSMEGLQGKVVLLNFFATWCPTCMKEMPALQNQVWKKYKDNENFMLVSIGREQNMEKMKKFQSKKDYEFHFAPDTGRVIYGQFARKYIPRNIVVDQGGNIVYQSTGYTEEEFQEMMDVIARKLGEE